MKEKERRNMLYRFLLCAAVVLLSCSAAFANIGQAGYHPVGTYANVGQNQDFSIGGFNMVKRIGGSGRVESDNTVNIGQCQATHAAGSTAMQKQDGTITQNASISGCGGLAKVIQNALVDGSQEQTIRGSRHGLQAQEQNLNVNLDNLVLKTGGVGRTEGDQAFVGSQRQILITPGVFGMNAQSVNVEQNGKLDGSPCSDIIIKSSVNIQMSQSQNICTTR